MPVSANLQAIPPSMDAGRAYMSPVTYAKHCAACHGLQFDPRFQESAPHDTPEVIHAFLVQKFQQYIPIHPAELRVLAPESQSSADQPIPPAVRVLTPATMGGASRGGIRRAALAEDVRAVPRADVSQRMRRCQSSRNQILRSAGSNTPCSITIRTNSCNASNATPARRPARKRPTSCCRGFRTCEKCHRGGREAAESRCFECHTYHDWNNEKSVKGTFTSVGFRCVTKCRDLANGAGSGMKSLYRLAATLLGLHHVNAIPFAFRRVLRKLHGALHEKPGWAHHPGNSRVLRKTDWPPRCQFCAGKLPWRDRIARAAIHTLIFRPRRPSARKYSRAGSSLSRGFCRVRGKRTGWTTWR